MTYKKLQTFQVPRMVYFHCYLAIGFMLLTFLSRQFLLRQPITSLQGELQQLPMRVGTWEGTESALDAETITTLGLDDWILRRYRHAAGAFTWFYIGVFAHTSIGGHHSPQICYPAGGWKILDKNIQQISFGAGQSIAINKLLVEKDLSRQLVLYWYQLGEKVLIDTDRQRLTGEYRFKLHHMFRILTSSRKDRALVRISTPVGDSADTALTHAVTFLQAIFPSLAQLFALEVTTP